MPEVQFRMGDNSLTSLATESSGLEVSTIYEQDIMWIYGTSKCLTNSNDIAYCSHPHAHPYQSFILQ